jgi:hypothetical protein
MIIIEEIARKFHAFLKFFYNSAQCEPAQRGASSQESKNPRSLGAASRLRFLHSSLLLKGLGHKIVTADALIVLNLEFSNPSTLKSTVRPGGTRLGVSGLLEFLASWILMCPVSLTRRIFLLGCPVRTVNERCS